MSNNTSTWLSALLLSATMSACGPATSPDDKSAAANAPISDDHGQDESDTHGDHDSHENEHADEVDLSPEQIRQLGITVETASKTMSGEHLELPAEIRIDADRIARLQPPVSGLVEKLFKAEGDIVEPGETLALVSSRELAGLKADYLEAQSDEGLAKQEFEREEKLFNEKVTAQADLLTARATLERASARRAAAETKLHALGVDHDILDNLPHARDGAHSAFYMKSPIAGQVAARSLSLGAAVSPDGEPAFVIVDTSRLWADIAVFKDDLSRIRIGAPVTFLNADSTQIAAGEIGFVSPLINERTRTATARVVLDNPDGKLRPGQFVTARIAIGSRSTILVPSEAIQAVEGNTAVFIPTDHGFSIQPVRTGSTIGNQTEITHGLSEGQPFVSTGAFSLKAELEKSAFGDGHAH
ncbi:MAG: efflux transporter periplasmic adaptor subunit [Hirschia sp.]|nr:efflux transporter periplasmic adaptor subunit [Hirschia sp.]MBF19010.1 efflux transporter periplasmic adaptor subunit [Hirschia sp.]|tara:strand:- start:1562 stop:2803 length:1242 start_codon:yes stop_codon:yes gene_type:complete